MKIVGLIQARMGSSRLPGKVMMNLAGKPIIRHLLDRLNKVNGLDGVILSTTKDENNDKMAAYAERHGAFVYRSSSEDNIAERLVNSSLMLEADAILKVNGDCPVADVSLLESMIKKYRLLGNVDYLSNKIHWTYPKGLSAEIISIKPLLWCHKNLSSKLDRELVCDWIRDNTEMFRVVPYIQKENMGHHDWMVDTLDDYKFMVILFDALYETNNYFGLNDVLNWLNKIRIENYSDV